MCNASHCEDSVAGGEWHRSCYLATLGALLARNTRGIA